MLEVSSTSASARAPSSPMRLKLRSRTRMWMLERSILAISLQPSRVMRLLKSTKVHVYDKPHMMKRCFFTNQLRFKEVRLKLSQTPSMSRVTPKSRMSNFIKWSSSRPWFTCNINRERFRRIKEGRGCGAYLEHVGHVHWCFLLVRRQDWSTDVEHFQGAVVSQDGCKTNDAVGSLRTRTTRWAWMSAQRLLELVVTN